MTVEQVTAFVGIGSNLGDARSHVQRALLQLGTLEPSPSPSPKQPRSELRTNESGRLEGTITLDIDPTTGLIAVESCPVIRTRTFVLGTEPKKYCGPEYHRPGATPQATRPRLTQP